MPLSSDNRIMALQLLAECGRISRQGLLDIMPFSTRNSSVVLKKLVDDKAIATYSQKRGESSYTLLSKGRDELSRLNPQRYTPELFEQNKLLKQNPDQSRFFGEVAALMSLADFAVHPADKPTLPAVTPDHKEFTPDTMKSLYRNERPHVYGEILPNHTLYTRRITPVNCYYDRSQIKQIISGADYGSRNARAAGVLFTPSHLFRVYHGDDSNIKFYRNGEEHFYSLLLDLFQGYRPPEKKAVLLLGRRFAPAESLINIHMNKIRDNHNKGTLLSPSNLGAPLYYLPVSAQALTLLRVMRYPDWHKTILIFATERRFGIKNQQAWVYDHEGRRIYIVADLNLTRFVIALTQIRDNPDRKALFLCLPWQVQFVEEQIRIYSDANPLVQLECLPTDFMPDTVLKALEQYWGG